jgi:hypothetical protein
MPARMALWAIEETAMPVSKKPEDFPGGDIEI